MTVYAVQNQMQKDHVTGDLVPKFDLRPAQVFGPVEFLLSPSASPFNPEPVILELHRKLGDFRADEDFLLLVGNPALIGLTVAIAVDYTGGPVRMLQWHGKDQRYIQIVADVFPDCLE